MATTYNPAIYDRVIWEDATASIGFNVPAYVPLTNLIVKYCLLDNENVPILTKLSTGAELVKTDQHVDISILPSDTVDKIGAFKHYCEAYSVDLTYKQPLFEGSLTIKRKGEK
jgi:hypothetical protein